MRLRADWKARPFPRAHREVDHTHVEIHHDVYRLSLKWTAEQHAKAIERDHFALNWNGPFYNLGIHQPTLTVVELRGIGRVSHGTALTVVLFGDHHNHDTPTSGVLEIIREIMRDYAPGPIDWHAKRAAGTKYASACPGMNAIPRIRNLKPAAPVKLPPPPPDLEDDMLLTPITVQGDANPKTQYAFGAGVTIFRIRSMDHRNQLIRLHQLRDMPPEHVTRPSLEDYGNPGWEHTVRSVVRLTTDV